MTMVNSGLRGLCRRFETTTVHHSVFSGNIGEKFLVMCLSLLVFKKTPNDGWRQADFLTRSPYLIGCSQAPTHEQKFL